MEAQQAQLLAYSTLLGDFSIHLPCFLFDPITNTITYDEQNTPENKHPLSSIEIDVLLNALCQQIRSSAVTLVNKITLLTMPMGRGKTFLIYYLLGKNNLNFVYLEKSELYDIVNNALLKTNINNVSLILQIHYFLSELIKYNCNDFMEILFDICYDFVLQQASSNNNLRSNETIKFYENKISLGLLITIGNTLIEWYQNQLDNNKNLNYLELFKDRFFIFLIESLKNIEDNRLVASHLFDNLCDFFGTMKPVEKEKFIFYVKQKSNQQQVINNNTSDINDSSNYNNNSSISSVDFSSNNNNFKEIIINHNNKDVYLKHLENTIGEYDRKEGIAFIIKNFLNHKSKTIRDSVVTFLGESFIKKFHKIYKNKINLNNEIISLDKYFIFTITFQKLKRKLKSKYFDNIEELKDFILFNYRNYRYPNLNYIKIEITKDNGLNWKELQFIEELEISKENVMLVNNLRIDRLSSNNNTSLMNGDLTSERLTLGSDDQSNNNISAINELSGFHDSNQFNSFISFKSEINNNNIPLSVNNNKNDQDLSFIDSVSSLSFISEYNNNNEVSINNNNLNKEDDKDDDDKELDELSSYRENSLIKENYNNININTSNSVKNITEMSPSSPNEMSEYMLSTISTHSIHEEDNNNQKQELNKQQQPKEEVQTQEVSFISSIENVSSLSFISSYQHDDIEEQQDSFNNKNSMNSISTISSIKEYDENDNNNNNQLSFLSSTGDNEDFNFDSNLESSIKDNNMINHNNNNLNSNNNKNEIKSEEKQQKKKSINYQYLLNDRYEIKDYLSRGAYGYILKGIDHYFDNNTHIVMKLLTVKNQKKIITKEALQQMSIRHNNIIPLIDIFEISPFELKQIIDYQLNNCKNSLKEMDWSILKTNLQNNNLKWCGMIMPYYGYGDLFKLINNNLENETIINRNNLYLIMKQLLNALNYLHNDYQMVHRDIKLNNILLKDLNNPILIDFDLAKKLSNNNNNLLITDKNELLKGSSLYWSPELKRIDQQLHLNQHIEEENNNNNNREENVMIPKENLQFEQMLKASDVFALGIVFYQLLSLDTFTNIYTCLISPHEDVILNEKEEKLLEDIKNNKNAYKYLLKRMRDNYLNEKEMILESIVVKMLTFDWKKRITASEALNLLSNFDNLQ
ncbi:hypothetical protein ABK040_013005 [Willaertia magna]